MSRLLKLLNQWFPYTDTRARLERHSGLGGRGL